MYSKIWATGGTLVPANMTINEARKRGGVNWEVKTAIIPSLLPPIGERITDLDAFADVEVMQRVENSPTAAQMLYRSNDRSYIATHGPDFRAVLNQEIFDLANSLQEVGLVRIEAIGNLRHRAMVWAFCEIQGCNYELPDGESVQPYLLIFNGHDALTRAGGIAIVDVRHPEPIILRSRVSDDEWFVKWSDNNQLLVPQLIERACNSNIEGWYGQLWSHSCNTTDFTLLMKNIYGSGISASKLQELTTIWESIPNNQTYWGVLNTVAINYQLKKTAETDEGEACRSRLDTIWFMEGKRRLSHTHKLLQEMMA